MLKDLYLSFRRLVSAFVLLIVAFLTLAAHAEAPWPFAGAQPSNPTATSSTTFVMMGLGVAGAGGGWSITPTHSGKVQFTVQGNIANGTASDGAALEIVTGITSVVAAPANAAAAPTNSVVCTNPAWNWTNASTVTASLGFVFTADCIVQGTPNQAMWADLGLKSITGGSSSVTNLQVWANEVR